MKNMHYFANPARFLRLSQRLLPWLAVGLVLSSGIGLGLALLRSPMDYKQGEMVRVMYVHVPAAWMAMGVYVGIVVASIMSLIWKHPLADVAARAMAPIGAVFTAICLVTGSIWGYPTWGTWWAWDGRMTSVLVLLFLYLGYMSLWSALEGQANAGKLTAILAIVGGINIPVIKFSVDWWNTLHQPASILRSGGMSIDASMAQPLFTMWLAYIFLFLCCLILRMQAMLYQTKVEARAARMMDAAQSHAILREPGAA
jgi:heme exporter protein C